MIALIHDTFKYRVDTTLPRAPTNDHAIFARQFAAEYVTDPSILTVIESHDEAFRCWRVGRWRGDWRAARDGVDRLIARLGEAVPLYVRFFRCDGHTASKDPAPLIWFEDYLRERGLEIP